MTRDELIEVMARAITGVSLGGPYPSAERMATAALLAIEAAGVRLVPAQPTEDQFRAGSAFRMAAETHGYRDTEGLYLAMLAATPGPWYAGHNKLGDPQGPMSIWPDPSMVGAVIARCGPQGMSQGWFEQPAKDAALIVAAVNALPELLAENERLREALTPFALVAEHDIGSDETDRDIFRPMLAHNHAPRLSVGDLRRARAALGDTP